MWYVIQVLSGQEDKACELINLHAAGQRSKDGRPVLKECFVPRYQVERKFHGQYRTLTRNLFPGYVIAVTNRVDELNDRLVRIPTFTRMLGSEKSFIPLDRSEKAFINALNTSWQSNTGSNRLSVIISLVLRFFSIFHVQGMELHARGVVPADLPLGFLLLAGLLLLQGLADCLPLRQA